MIHVGVTGHRPHRLIVSEKRLALRINRVLSSLSGAMSKLRPSEGAALQVLSPLAEGTDQIVARQALALDHRLAVLLPFAERDYESTFTDKQRIAEFRGLLKQADEVTSLKGNLKRAEAAYVAVGNVTVARSDLILTIWDGKLAQGRGGTPEILQNALEWQIPIIWIDATIDRAPRLILRKRQSTLKPVLATVARSAPVLDAAAHRALVASIMPSN